MSALDDFAKTTEWLLDELQREIFAVDGGKVRFIFSSEKNAPSQREQERAIRWLVVSGAVRELEDINEEISPILAATRLFEKQTRIGFEMTLNEQVFNEILEIFQRGRTKRHTAEAILKKIRQSVHAKKLREHPREELAATVGPRLDQETQEVLYQDQSVKIPTGNQWQLCLVLFELERDVWIEETKAIEGFYKKDGKQSLYDACRALNRRCRSILNGEKLVEFRGAKARINPKLFKVSTNN